MIRWREDSGLAPERRFQAPQLTPEHFNVRYAHTLTSVFPPVSESLFLYSSTVNCKVHRCFAKARRTVKHLRVLAAHGADLVKGMTISFVIELPDQVVAHTLTVCRRY